MRSPILTLLAGAVTALALLAPAQAETPQAESARAESARAESARAESARAESARAESARAAAPGGSSYEIWQRAERAYPQNRTNPLAGRLWGVYQGPQDQVWSAYQQATPAQRQQLDTIALRPRTKWYGAFVPDAQIRSTVQRYIAGSQAGDPTKLVQFAVFRMEPWEHPGCATASTPEQVLSYRTWIDELAAGVGATPTLVVMQPDMPFLWCVPDRKVKAQLLRYATRTLSALPNTSVYLDAGAADWCENGKGAQPKRCAALLCKTGIAYARGFALDSTHYTGPSENIRHGAEIAAILERAGFGKKHFIIDTAKSGRPTTWSKMRPSEPDGLKDDARVCKTKKMKRCVTLGIPPTVRVADPRWGLSPSDRRLARTYVDGFVWFGRPWLYRQADPFVMSRALTMVASTPYPGPRVG